MNSRAFSFVFFGILSVIGILPIILGAIAWYRTDAFYLPIPISLAALSTLLPLITAALAAVTRTLSTSQALAKSSNYNRIQILNLTLPNILTIVQTIIATIAITLLYPDSILSCRLEQQWQSFFHSKNAQAIRAIQDGLRCCGLRSIHDRAWPFKDAEHGDNACAQRFGYTRSCFQPWRGMQQNAAVMVFAAAVLAWMLQVGLVYGGTPRRGNWEHDAARRSGLGVDGRNPRLLPYSDVEPGEDGREEGNEDNRDEGANQWAQQQQGGWSNDAEGEATRSGVHPSQLGSTAAT